jgi:broad specificity phosphatase PhoE
MLRELWGGKYPDYLFEQAREELAKSKQNPRQCFFEGEPYIDVKHSIEAMVADAKAVEEEA